MRLEKNVVLWLTSIRIFLGFSSCYVPSLPIKAHDPLFYNWAEAYTSQTRGFKCVLESIDNDNISNSR